MLEHITSGHSDEACSPTCTQQHNFFYVRLSRGARKSLLGPLCQGGTHFLWSVTVGFFNEKQKFLINGTLYGDDYTAWQEP